MLIYFFIMKMGKLKDNIIKPFHPQSFSVLFHYNCYIVFENLILKRIKKPSLRLRNTHIFQCTYNLTLYISAINKIILNKLFVIIICLQIVTTVNTNYSTVTTFAKFFGKSGLYPCWTDN